MNLRTALLTSLLFASLPTQATEYSKTTMLSDFSVQGLRPVQTSTQNTIFISFKRADAWDGTFGSGGAAPCSPAAAVLPNNPNNPMDAVLRATALAAIASGASVYVTVDNTLPMLYSYCVVTMITIKAP